MPEVARNGFNIGEVWNSVCCHGNKTVELVLRSTFSRIILQRIKHFGYKLAEISFLIIIMIKIWSSVWHHHLANLHNQKTWVSREWKEIFENSKHQFSPYTDYFFVLKAWIRKVPFSSYSTTVSLKFAPSLMMTSHCKPGCPLARGLWLCVLKLDGMRANTLLVFSRTYMWYEPCYI